MEPRLVIYWYEKHVISDSTTGPNVPRKHIPPTPFCKDTLAASSSLCRLISGTGTVLKQSMEVILDISDCVVRYFMALQARLKACHFDTATVNSSCSCLSCLPCLISLLRNALKKIRKQAQKPINHCLIEGSLWICSI